MTGPGIVLLAIKTLMVYLRDPQHAIDSVSDSLIWAHKRDAITLVMESALMLSAVLVGGMFQDFLTLCLTTFHVFAITLQLCHSI